MRKTRSKIEEYLECDGCNYIMKEEGHTSLTVMLDDEPVEFHFHGFNVPARSDCFRYWAHNPRIMERSLVEREFSSNMIEEFMSIMLYRSGPFSPGVEREKIK